MRPPLKASVKKTGLMQDALDLLVLKTLGHAPIHGYGIAQLFLISSRKPRAADRHIATPVQE